MRVTVVDAPRRDLPTDRIAFWATAAVVLVAALFRQAGVPKWSTLWAEDGQVFLACAYREGIGCLFTPYQGYLHAAPRIGAAIAALPSPVDASVVVTLVAAIVAALAAGLAARAIAAVTGSWLAATIGAAGLGLVWEAGREVLGNMANLHWVLFAATLIVLVCSWVGGRIGRADLVLVAVTGLTSALSPVLAIVAIPAALRRAPLARIALLLAGVTAATQIVAELVSERIASGAAPVAPLQVARRFAKDVLRDGSFGPDLHLVGWLVPAALGALVVLIALRHRADLRLLLRELLPIVALPAIGAGVYIASAELNRTLNDRYAYLPAALAIAALAIAAPRAAAAVGTSWNSGRRALVPRFLAPVVTILLVAGFASSFVLTARASNGPDVPAEIRTAGSACTAGVDVVAIDISPKPASDHWTVPIPCDRLR